MSGRVRLSPQRGIILALLLLILCSLAVHIIAEGFQPGMLSIVTTGQAGHAFPLHEHSEDLFIYFLLIVSLPVYQYFSALFIDVTHIKSFSISPQNPPPNH